MILGYGTILNAVTSGDIIIDPFNKRLVGPNSIDVHLGPIIKEIMPNDGVLIDPELPQVYIEHNITNGYVLKPGKLYIASTLEVAGSKKYVPMIEGRSSIGRLGLRIHQTAGFGDVGFIGRWTLEIDCIIPIRIYSCMRIAQVFFHDVSDCDMLYTGRYQGQSDATESRYAEKSNVGRLSAL